MLFEVTFSFFFFGLKNEWYSPSCYNALLNVMLARLCGVGYITNSSAGKWGQGWNCAIARHGAGGDVNFLMIRERSQVGPTVFHQSEL